MNGFAPIWVLAGVVLCGIVQGFDDALGERLSLTVHESTEAMSMVTGRVLHGLRKMPEGLQTGSPRQAVSGRSLLQNHDAHCRWEGGKCSVGAAIVARMVKDSTSPMAIYLRDVLDCRMHHDEGRCKARGCVWEYGECMSSFSGKHGFWKCAGDSTELLKISVQRQICQRNYATESECSAQDKCTWYHDKCRADGWRLHLGIPSYKEGQPAGLIEAVNKRNSELAPFSVDGEAMSGVSASAIFDWNAPSFQCPTGVDERLCYCAQASVDGIFRTNFYCAKKYNSAGATCDQDPLCTSIGSACKISDAELIRINGGAIEEIISRTSDLRVRKAFLATIQCLQKTQDACFGACVWSESDSPPRCIISDSWIYQQVAGNAEKSSIPMCKAVATFLKSGCPGSDWAGCSANARCHWNTEAGLCKLSEREVVQDVIESDPNMSHFLPEWGRCAARKNRAACFS